ncbi:glycosyltransferase family 4 protein [Paenibacillus wynnii]|uniref:glycosyltransferase family 4 protein n=1 Tax=Paenibacillus wynnii TaxID=268407 RepID=UPI00279140C7|nr:glycosyltransferase family 4 protein [Paenibacillus wynnii]MDQ0192096.1 glycosyltransferase involved in cell wall biosynthesis [Paenibacillus wynnii]
MKKVLFISGCFGDTQRYRVFNQMEQLEYLEINVIERYFADYDIISALDQKIDIVIMHRVPHTLGIEYFISTANKMNVPVIFDVDDLVYEKEYAKYSDGINYLEEEEKALYFEGIERYKKTIELCDGAIVTTEFLAETIAKYNDNVYINRNAISLELEDICETFNCETNVHSERIRIGYFSGSKTHNKDFLQISDALLKILKMNTQTDLVIGGLLDLSKEFDAFKNRIIRLPLVGWRDLPSSIQSIHINLAPLEIDNPFCRAKSELKYFEAGILGIPTVASKIDAFQHAIKDGENGYLAETSLEWFEKLELLINQEELRLKIGKNAYNHVKNNYTVKSRAKSYLHILSQITKQSNNKKIESKVKLTVNFLIPQPFIGSGGHTTILRMARYLCNDGNKVNIYVQDGENFDSRNDKLITDFIDKHFFVTGANYFREDAKFKESDVFIATSWPTAYRINSVTNSKSKFYFIQDYEPYFYPMSSEYKLAENSYKLNLRGITIGKWLTKKVKNNFGMDCDYIDFSTDNNIYLLTEPKIPNNKTKIIFYARNSTPRRGVELGLQALELVDRRFKGSIEIILFGGDKDLKTNFPHTNLGVLTTDELADLYKSADLALVVSLTNASLLPLELMASRCAVIDIDDDTIEGVVRNNINGLLAKADPIDLADKISALVENVELRSQLQQNSYEFTKDLNWEISGQQFERIIISKTLFEESSQRIRELKNVGNEEIVKPMAPLTYGVSYGGTIRLNDNNFSRVDIYFGNYNRVNEGSLTFHLKKFPNSINDIFSLKVDLKNIRDNTWFSFNFDPIVNSENQEYYFFIESDANETNAVTVYGNDKGNNIYVNHYKNQGSICYRTYCTNYGHFVYNTITDREVTDAKSAIHEEGDINEIALILKQKIANAGANNYAVRELQNKVNDLEIKLIKITNSTPIVFYKKMKKVLARKWIKKIIGR